jgi:2-polyprenyl-3-methyl-5-hydroxy-6-metoxy-1,4-benzoquinol methylase
MGIFYHNMQKNKDLELFYKNVYKKGERKHFSTFLIGEHASSSENLEVLKEIKWKGKTVLEVGCGTGLFSYSCAKKGANVLGIDYADEAIRLANKKYQHKNLKFENIDVKYIKNKYDVIVSIGTLEHTDKPYKVLNLLKSHLNKKGKIIITTPNWTNPRGYMLMTLQLLFDAPITLVDLHYLTPINHMEWAKKLQMKLKWRTVQRSWAHGDILIEDFKRRIPNVLRDAGLPNDKIKVNRFINWIKKYVNTLDNSSYHSGAVGLYVYEL